MTSSSTSQLRRGFCLIAAEDFPVRRTGILTCTPADVAEIRAIAEAVPIEGERLPEAVLAMTNR